MSKGSSGLKVDALTSSLQSGKWENPLSRRLIGIYRSSKACENVNSQRQGIDGI